MGGIQDDRGDRRGAALGAPLRQPARDVLGAGHRVVDHHREGEREAGERDRVERLPEQVQRERRRDERGRDRHEHDEHRAPVHEDGDERERQQHGGDDDRRREVARRLVDEARRPEDGGVGLQAGEARPELLQCRLDALRDLLGVGARELLDDEQQALGVVDDGVADERLVVLDDVGDVGQPQPAGAFDGNLAELLGIGDLVEDVANLQALLRRLDEAAGARNGGLEVAHRGRDLRVAGGADDLAQRDVLLTQPLGADLDLDLLVAHAPDGDVRDARHAHEARPQRPARDDRLLDRRQVLRGEADHHHAARRRQRLQHRRRLGDVGEGGSAQLGEALLHELATLVDVVAGLEHQHDRRQARQRGGADDVDALDAVEQVRLERDRQQLLDLGRRQAEGFSLDLDVRRGELGIDVHGRVAERHDADDHDRGGDADDEAAEPQRRTDDRADHGAEHPRSRLDSMIPCIIDSPHRKISDW